MDYDGCAAALANPSRDVARVLRAYPVAVVHRTHLAAETADALATSSLRDSSLSSFASASGAPEQLGSISSVQIVSFGSATNMPTPGEGGAAVEMVLEQVVDSYRPALESCFEVLQTKLLAVPQVAIEDNTFSLTVTHRGAEEAEAEAVRELVATLLADEYPMLRLEDERTQLNVRPDPAWNRSRLVEWIVSQVVELVENKLGHCGVIPVYLGEDAAFRHLPAIGGLDILITGGPAIDSYFLRSAMQVDDLLRWLADQHMAGVTVRGGRLRPPKQPPAGPAAGKTGKPGAGGKGGPTVKRVQIMQQELTGDARAGGGGKAGGEVGSVPRVNSAERLSVASIVSAPSTAATAGAALSGVGGGGKMPTPRSSFLDATDAHAYDVTDRGP